MACVSARKVFGIIIPFFAIFLMSQNVSAVDVSSANVRRGFSNYTANILVNDDNMGSRNIPFELLNYDTTYVRRLYGVSASTVVNDNQNNKYKTISVNFTLAQDIGGNMGSNDNPIAGNLNAVLQVTASNQTYNGSCSNLGWGPSLNGSWYRYGRSWTCEVYLSDYQNISAFSIVVGSVSGNSLGSNSLAYTGILQGGMSPAHASIYVTSLSYTINSTADPMIQGQQTMINQNNTIIQQNTNINNNIQDVEDAINSQNEKEDQAIDNIDNQSPSDISDATSQQTTSLIGVLQSFLAELTSFSATNCNVVLPFPSFMGGNMSVNICQHKDKAGSFISIIGSLIMIGFYIPFVYAVLKMIYNEIRSFSNG